MNLHDVRSDGLPDCPLEEVDRCEQLDETI
jgi:hypothetical protein